MSKVNEISISYSFKSNSEILISSSKSCSDYLKTIWKGIEIFESFNVLFLNKKNHVKGFYELSKGGIDSTVVDIRLLFGIALKSCSTGIIISHNHPSGSLKRSKADDLITKKIAKASKFLDIAFLDHIIMTPSGEYFSYADNNVLNI